LRNGYKKERLNKIIILLKEIIDDDIQTCGVPKGRTADLWLRLINENLPKQAKLRNTKELSFSVFRVLPTESNLKSKIKFIVTKQPHAVTCEGYRINQVEYKLGYKGEK